jgi:hypothetical protein
VPEVADDLGETWTKRVVLMLADGGVPRAAAEHLAGAELPMSVCEWPRSTVSSHASRGGLHGTARGPDAACLAGTESGCHGTKTSLTGR